jgi:hypothetical protein
MDKIKESETKRSFYYITKGGIIDRTRGWFLDEKSVQFIVIMLTENFPNEKWGWVYE